MVLLKFLLITFLVIFILSRFFGFIFRTMFWLLGMRAGQRQTYRQPQQQARPTQQREGEVTIDYVPKPETQKHKNGFNDGEYVNYEEVK